MKPFDPKLMKYAKATKNYILFISVTGLISAVLIIAQSIIIAKIIAPVINGQSNPDATWLMWTLVTIALIRITVSFLSEPVAHKSATSTIAQLRKNILQHSLQLGPRWQGENSTELVTLATRGINNLSPYFIEYLPQLFLSATVTPIALLIVFGYDYWSAIIIAVTLPLIPIFMWLIGVMTQGYANAKLQVLQKLGAQLLDLLSGLTTLKALGREKGPAQRIAFLGQQYKKTTMATLRVAFLSGAVLELLTTICVALVAVSVGMRLVYGLVDLETGLIVIMLAPEVFNPLRQVGAKFHACADGVAAINKAMEILQTPLPQDGTTACPDLAKTTITVKDLSIYSRSHKAPHKLNATISAGELVAFAGESGSGKTSAIMALLKLIKADEGQILLQTDKQSINLNDIKASTLYQQVAWVAQNPVIFSGTVEENLSSFTQNYTPEQLMNASAQTGFDKVIQSLPQGLQTPIGNKGVGLSLGQRQKLALTKAILNDAQVVILDEPTAHLDAQSEMQILETVQHLHAQGKTILVIAHRKTLLNIADKVIHVECTPLDEDTSKYTVADSEVPVENTNK